MIDSSPLLRPLLALAALALAPALAACSVAQAQTDDDQTARQEGGRECFFARQVNGFRNIDDDETRVLVDVRAGETFEFELQRRCPELRFARSIRFDVSGVGRVCNGLEVDLIVPEPNLGSQRCPVTMIRRLAADEPGARIGARE